MRALLLFLAMFATGCQLDIEVEHQIDPEPIVIQLCVNGWLWDVEGFPVVNEQGAQETCAEDY